MENTFSREACLRLLIKALVIFYDQKRVIFYSTSTYDKTKPEPHIRILRDLSLLTHLRNIYSCFHGDVCHNKGDIHV